jgi:uncharacterized membrane protein YedE/YeeE
MIVPFDARPALAGGALIGSAAVVLMIADGKVPGISGIVAGLLRRPGEGTGWRLAFLVGLLAGVPLVTAALGHAPHVQVAASLPVLALAGLLVGYGTRLGSGCTSGHGVCGLSRLSPRSIAAVLTFLAAAILTVTLVRHVIGTVS